MRSRTLMVANGPHAGVDNTKTLGDLCMQSIMSNLHSIRQAGRFLATVHKEQLIERLAFHDMLTVDYLPHVTYNLFSPQLKHIHLYKCPQVTDSLLKQLAESRCKLRVLTLHRLPNVTDAGVIAITYGQEELETLALRKLTKLTSHGLSQVASPALRVVDLVGCSSLTADGVRALVSRNRSISKLNLGRCVKVEVSVLSYLTQTLGPKLLELELEELHALNDSCLQSIGENCQNLTKLNIHDSNRVTHVGITTLLERCQQLESLDLSYCTNLAVPPGAKCLLKLPISIRELSLCGVMLADDELLVQALSRLSHLRSVRLCGVTALNDETMHKILAEIGANLTMIDLSGSIMSSITDEGLRAITLHCTSLRILCLSLMKHITGMTLLPMLRNEQRAMNLKTLLLSSRKIDIELLYAAATNCKGLVDIDMSGLATVDDNLLYALAENCPLLAHIGLKGCRQVTDAGICKLAYNCPLVCIALSGIHSLTDRSIFAIANSCPHLEEISLNGCSQITRQAITYLMDCCLPRVYVEHKVPNANPDQLMARNLDTGEFCRADLLPHDKT